MIQLGKVQKLKVVKKSQIGIYLNSQDDETDTEILLPNHESPENIQVGNLIEAFVYQDSEGKMISTTKIPKLTVGEIAALKAVKITRPGAFMDWGLDTHLFLPFEEQRGKIEKDGIYLVGLHIDKKNGLSATMNVYSMLNSESPYKKNDRAKGTIYSINEKIGAFVAVDNKYHGLILNKELFCNCAEGDTVDVRIKRVREDGKLELSLRSEAYNEIEHDVRKIMDRLEQGNGILLLNDKSAPECIKSELGISKAAFKRAVGRLLKEGAIEITTQGIKRTW
jgi:predicted RNA-binding protein (virulence factor B family)